MLTTFPMLFMLQNWPITHVVTQVIKTESLSQKAELGSTLRQVLLQLAKRKFIAWQVEHTGRNTDNNAFSLVIQQCCLYYLTLKDNCSNLKLGFHMIVQIVLIIPVIPNNVQTVRTIVWNHTPAMANNPDDWDDLDRLDRTEFYPDNQDDRVDSEAIIQKPSQMTEMMGMIKGYNRNHHPHSSNPEVEKIIIQICSHCVWVQFKKEKVR